jgi:hypothetical protein
VIFDVFSRRNAKRLRQESGKPDEIFQQLRNRILLLIHEVISGNWTDGRFIDPGNVTREFWAQIHNSLQHLYGRFQLSTGSTASPGKDVLTFLAACPAVEFFDFIELTFKTDALSNVLYDQNCLVEGINEILKNEEAFYQLTSMVKREDPAPSGIGRRITITAWPKVIRVEEEITFVEAVAPALSILSGPDYGTANLEFRDALEEYRKGHYGDCLVKCGSAFESVLKVLCTQNGWTFNATTSTAAPLIKTVLANTKLDSFFEQPLTLIATLRNRLSTAHGGGTATRSVEPHIAQYAITSTAAALVLLVREVGP